MNYMMSYYYPKALLAITAISLLCVACDRSGFKEAPPTIPVEDERKRNFGKAMGEEFLLFGTPATKKTGDQTALANVNAYIWRASLDTLAFMPLQSIDAAGGVIITDWYSTPNAPQERIKISVRILDNFLRSDSLKVIINKQVLKSGQWVEAFVEADVKEKMETIILSKARQMRIQSITDSAR